MKFLRTASVRRIAAAIVAGVIAAAPASAAFFEKVRTAGGREIDALPGQVIVRYRAGADGDGLRRLESAGARERRSISSLGLHLLSTPPGLSVEAYLAQLRSDPSIEFAEPNGVVRALAFPVTEPNDAQFSSQYALRYDTVTFPASINVRDAWAVTTGNANVIVAVVDTGVNQAHADLAGQLVAGEKIEIDWLNNGNCTDTPQNNSALNGVGPDQCGGTSSPPDHDPEDDNNIDPNTGNLAVPPVFHGTHVSGIIAAKTDNGTDIAGVAPGCKVMPVKALNSWGFGSFVSIAEGITWAADHGASVINLSLGGEGSDTSGSIQTAVSHALEKDCVLVAAAGNSGNNSSVNFPASFTGVIAAGAINSANQLSSFSATGKDLDVVAPGENILSLTKPSAQNGFATNSSENGTSFSAPIVAGVAALIRSVDKSLTWPEVTKYIDFTADHLPAGSTSFNNNFGFGRVNAGAAILAAKNHTQFVSDPADPGSTFPYPNPFRPATNHQVTFSLPQSLGSESIEIDIMNVAGEKVKTLSGTNVWDGRGDGGDLVASGFYFYRAKTSKGDVKGKITVLK